MSKHIQKILIRGVNWIGDAVLTTPSIHALRRAFPDAHISLLVKPWVAELFRENPDINELILYEDRFKGITGKLRLAKLLKARGFHSAILLQNAFDAALITWLAHIPERIGYSRDMRRPLLTKPIELKKEIHTHHQVYYYLSLLKEALGIKYDNPEPALYLKADETHDARTLLEESLDLSSETLLVGINPGATYGSAKRWMPERFAELIQNIISELNGRVVLFGSREEEEIANEIISRVLSPRHALLNMAGKTDLRQLAALINECDIFISNDSGPMHMASALLVPTVAIFGSTDSNATGPFGTGHAIVNKGVSCSPCFERDCPEKHIRCMTDISSEDVFEALKEIMPKERAVFLDRDGTLNEDTGYLSSFSDLKIFNGVPESLRRLKEAGFRLIGITNQSGIARGLVTEEFVLACNAYLQKTFNLDDFFYCPHHPDEDCGCRKPKSKLLRKARLEHHINLRQSYVIGDKTLDVLLAKAVGAKGILVQTGHDRESADADFIARDLKEAVDWILEKEKLK
jgi:heptosyltransferase-2